jgi:hypothetical protein
MVMTGDPARLEARGRARKGEKGPNPYPQRENAAFRLPGPKNKASDLNAPLDASHRGIRGTQILDNVTYMLSQCNIYVK